MDNYNYNYLLHHNIEKNAVQYPEKTVFKCGKESINYKDFNTKIKQLSYVLVESGSGKGERVAILMNRSLESAIAIYGILSAGAAYVPIDPKLPIERIKFLIEDCDIQRLITVPSQRRIIKTLLAECDKIKQVIGYEVDGIESLSWEKIGQQQDVEFKCPHTILEEDLAYILYTSGSTGVPKGIMHSHRSAMAFAELAVKHFDITENDIIGNHAPIFFDISTLAYFAGPQVGACSVIFSDSYVALPASLCKAINDEKITIWYSVPLALIQMLESQEFRSFPDLRAILYAGEAFPIKQLSMVMEILPNIDIWNLYGPTETNVCTIHKVQSSNLGMDNIPIGKVWDKTDFLIIDENDKEVAADVKGELLIRSVTRMLGYWKNKELTASSTFWKKEASGQSKEYYRTGDLVTENEDGVLHLKGRKDNQIKIRGYRLELGDIEAAFLKHDSVLEAAALLCDIDADEKYIQIVLRVNEKSQVDNESILRFVKKILPFYALPKELIFLDSFPRTNTGKIQRQALKASIIKE